MSEANGVAVVGCYHTAIRRDVRDRSLEEMIFEAAQGALADAEITIDAIDGVILSTADQASGRVIESMVTSGAAGGVGRDVTTLASAGEHALVYAYMRLLAGQGQRLLVLSWSKTSESRGLKDVQRMSAEPFLLRPLGLDVTVAAGFQASAYQARFGLDADTVTKVRERRYAAASAAYGRIAPKPADLVAWPLTAADLPQMADVACAMVVTAAPAVGERDTPAWIRGVGWSTDRYELAERDLTRFVALESAARRAGVAALDADAVVEVDEISVIGGFAACESLGLCSPGQGGEFAAGDGTASLRVNRSGGSLPVNAGNASGFLRFLCAAQQVRGRAGGMQVDPWPRHAIGAALHGFAGQGAAVVTFASEAISR
jgi:hypothetical protein